MTIVWKQRLAPPLWMSLAFAAVLRIGFAAVTSHHFTPNDSRVYFRLTGQLIGRGEDPLSHLPGRQWNFLQLMPYIHALESHSGLAWVYAVKIAPIAADVIVVWLVSRLATTDGLTRALQYALNPLSLLVVSLHGQVEPVALAFALGGMLLVRQNKWFTGGILVGAAVAAKTWPVLFILALLPVRSPTKVLRLGLGAMLVPAAMMTSGVLFLDTRVASSLHHIVSYSSYVYVWGWSGALVTSGHDHLVGYDSAAGRVGSALAGLAVLAALVAFRNKSAQVRAAAALCAFLVATAGFGIQYLMWPLPLLFAVGRVAHIRYAVAAAGWAAVAYLARWESPRSAYFLSGLSWLVIATLLAAIWELWRSEPDAARADVAQNGSTSPMLRR